MEDSYRNAKLIQINLCRYRHSGTSARHLRVSRAGQSPNLGAASLAEIGGGIRQQVMDSQPTGARHVVSVAHRRSLIIHRRVGQYRPTSRVVARPQAPSRLGLWRFVMSKEETRYHELR
jgi:hypothetical protein